MATIDFTPKDEKRARRDFTREDLLERVEYCPDSGVFRWKRRVMCFGGGRMPGDIAGTAKDGYVQITLFGRQYRAHHLAWLVMTGEWPPTKLDIDHINQDRSDNRWSNLRLASRGQNNLNTKSARSDNVTGHRGVHPTRGRWFARITVDKKIVHLGVFDTKEEAIEARKSAEKKYYPEFA